MRSGVGRWDAALDMLTIAPAAPRSMRPRANAWQHRIQRGTGTYNCPTDSQIQWPSEWPSDTVVKKTSDPLTQWPTGEDKEWPGDPVTQQPVVKVPIAPVVQLSIRPRANTYLIATYRVIKVPTEPVNKWRNGQSTSDPLVKTLND